MGVVNGDNVRIMLNYKEAVKKVLEFSRPLWPQKTALAESLGLVLARDIFSPRPLPGFDNSAVDGYAIGDPDYLASEGRTLKFEVQGEISAGRVSSKPLKKGFAMRVFTGARIPKGTWAVVMQEETSEKNGWVYLSRRPNRRSLLS